MRLDDALRGGDGVRAGGEVDGDHIVRLDLRTAPLRLLAHLPHELRTADSTLVSGKVLNHRRAHELSSGHAAREALEDEGLQARPTRVDRRSVPSGTAADDDQILNVELRLLREAEGGEGRVRGGGGEERRRWEEAELQRCRATQKTQRERRRAHDDTEG